VISGQQSAVSSQQKQKTKAKNKSKIMPGFADS
jgi:hypothetical protein